MNGVQIIDEPITDVALSLREDVCEYTEQAFKMYRGEPVEITLQFDNKLIGSVYDKFGENTKMVRLNAEQCVANVKVQISPTFWGWIFQFGKQVQILNPDHIKKEYQNKIGELMI